MPSSVPTARLQAIPQLAKIVDFAIEEEGQVFESTGDTAIMLRALGLHGSAAASWLRGMFAFGCWDPKQRRLLLARDPFGIKPLYPARRPNPDAGWSVAFASELRPLLLSGLLGTPHLDPQAVASGVWNGFVAGPGTAVRGVELVWPRRFLEFDGAGKEVRQEEFWCIPDHAPSPSMDEHELAVILEEGLRLHLASDVPLAVFLSGGVDSSVTANLAQRVSQKPIHTFTLGFEEQEFNEAPRREKDRRRHRDPAPRAGADGGALRRKVGGRARQSGPADL
jgi:asparagine synthase (glutamine-hydrolysing)